MDNIQEIWKDVIGFEGLYAISNHGNCKSLRSNINLSPEKTKSRHLRVVLYNEKRNRYQLHRLVAIHFIPNERNKPCVCHKDNNPTNNHFSNLYWGTHSDNTKQAIADGLMKPSFRKGHNKTRSGQDNHKTKLRNIHVSVIRDAIEAGHSLSKIGKYFKTTKGTIWKIKAGYSWRWVY